MALDSFSLEIVSGILHLLMNTVEEVLSVEEVWTMPVFLEHLECTDTKQNAYFYLENIWNAIEQIKKDKYILIQLLLSFYKL